MAPFKDKKNIDEVRQRLYERGRDPEEVKRHSLHRQESDVPTEWSGETDDDTKQSEVAKATPVSREQSLAGPTSTAPPPTTATSTETTSEVATDFMPRKKRRYRTFILGFAFLLLVVVVGLSSIFLYTGGNDISPRNIEVAINGPFAVAGGEVLPIQVGITNQNTANIESATLIMRYPSGTRTTGENARDVFEERLPLETITGGETVNVPVRVTVFGEENEEKEVNATVEYRLVGSNGTFFKDAEPYTFRVNSSPLTLAVENVQKVASGQEVDITLRVSSNAPSTLNNVLVTAEYPTGFDYSSADPEPFFGQNTWLIDSLEPEGEQEIVLTGVVLGQTNDEFVINYQVGTPSDENRYMMQSVLANGRSEFLIERPFIDVGLSVGGQSGDVAIVSPGQAVESSISITNTLSETVYDMVVEASVSGSSFEEESVTVEGGYYESERDIVRWEQSTNRSLEEVTPGEANGLSFEFIPVSQDSTPTFEVRVDVYARRVAEPGSSEELIGSAVATVRTQTEVSLMSDAGRNTGSFSDTGPHPPVAETPSRYTLNMAIDNGSNDIIDTEVITSLPPNVSWLDLISGDGTFVFNPVSRQLNWELGTVEANSRAEVSFQVELRPSLSNVERVLPLLGEQRLRATDRFTGTVVRSTAPPISTELSSEAGYEGGNGRVQASAEILSED